MSRSTTSGAIRTRPIEIRLRADVPHHVMEDLRARYAGWILACGDEELVDLSGTAEWKDFEERQTPGSWIAGLRRQQGWTQRELGERLGGVATARVSDWEHGRRAVSKSFAKMLADLFKVSAERFIE